MIPLPESALLSVAGDLAAPLINKNGIEATYYAANAHQTRPYTTTSARC